MRWWTRWLPSASETSTCRQREIAYGAPSRAPGARGRPRVSGSQGEGMTVGKTLDQEGLDRLFLAARTQNGWLPTPVSDGQLKQIYEIMKMGPTSANSCPARIVFVRTPEAKARLLPALSPGNVDKTKAA